MADNSIFKRVPIEVPNRSGFNEDHENLFTAMPGTLTPCFVDELNPGDTITLGQALQVQLPPTVTDFYGRVQARVETFFVPYRLLWSGWREFITHPTNNAVWPTSNGPVFWLPRFTMPLSTNVAGSLADYLSFRSNTPAGQYTAAEVGNGSSLIGEDYLLVRNPLRFLAYHMIWNHWYRDPRIQKECFASNMGIATAGGSGSSPTAFNNITSISSWPSVYYQPNGANPAATYAQCAHPSATVGRGTLLADGVNIYELRQRLYDRDYFTNATTSPQAGTPASVSISSNQFTIAQLRQANALQQWMEKNNIAGYDYWAQMYAHFGVTPPDYSLDRPVYLGRNEIDIYNKSVYQSTPTTSNDTSNSSNPFAGIGAKFGSPQGVGDGSLVDEFTAKEHGVVMSIFTLYPQAVYDLALDRHYFDCSSADFPFPVFAGVGDQPIYDAEVSFAGDSVTPQVWGYTQRYAHYKHKKDEVHGLMRSQNTLSNFALKRTFTTVPQLGSQFLEVPTDSLDEVMSVSASASSFACWVDMFFRYRKISTLPAYSIPTLGEPSNTHTVTIQPGGSRL